MSSPGVFGLPHLSEDAVAAFADGVLSPSAAARAQRHCRECGECADAVRGQRETAMTLRTAAAPALPSGLLDRLAGLPMSASLPPPRGGLPTAVGADGVPVFITNSAREQPAEQPAEPPAEPGPPDRSAQSSASTGVHRRGVLPMSVLASAAAVVAAGTFGGHVAALQGAADRMAPGSAVTLAGTSVPRSGLGPNLRGPAERGSAAGHLPTGPLGSLTSAVSAPFNFTPALPTAAVPDAAAGARTGSAASSGRSNSSAGSTRSTGKSADSANSSGTSLSTSRWSVSSRPTRAMSKPAAKATPAKPAAKALAAKPAVVGSGRDHRLPDVAPADRGPTAPAP
jgi:hypothetical protein